MGLKSAIVGLGHSGPNGHLPALLRNPRTELVAVCDLDHERTRRLSNKYDVDGFSDIESMLRSSDLDWVHVCTPVQTHFEIVKQILEQGIHVLVQKPVTTTVAEIEELITTAKRSNAQLSVVHNQQFIPVIRSLKRQVNAGELGEIRATETIYSGEGRPDISPRGDWVFDLPGGELEDGIPHPIYLALATGGYPRDKDAISTTTRSLNEYAHGISYDGMSVEYVAENGALCSIKVLAEGIPRRELTIHGDEKSISIDMISMNARIYDERDGRSSPRTVFRRDVEDVSSIFRGLGTNSIGFCKYVLENTFEIHSESSTSGTYYQINEAAKSLQTMREPPVTIEEAKWTMEIMEQVRQHAKH